MSTYNPPAPIHLAALALAHPSESRDLLGPARALCLLLLRPRRGLVVALRQELRMFVWWRLEWSPDWRWMLCFSLLLTSAANSSARLTVSPTSHPPTVQHIT